MREVKRLIDVVAAACGLILLAPLLGLIAAAIRWKLGSPVLFRHLRIGKDERPFVLYKFRTMTEARDSAGRLLPDAQRLTGLGRLLRSTSLDELPQLWNVLKGEMSLVGPRPLVPRYLPRYNRRQRRRHEALPGITGWAQIHGRNTLSWEQKFELDVWYVDHWSLWLDLKILAITLARVLERKGVNQAGDLASPEFLGNPEEEDSTAPPRGGPANAPAPPRAFDYCNSTL
jgi:lipopolysaccharide/colanic/teichoic acid biosynthesis glycosyltransferase